MRFFHHEGKISHLLFKFSTDRMKRCIAGLVIAGVCLATETKAQISGCTDPLATNYNGAATINDGSCLYNSVSVTPVSSNILATSLSETSGLIFWNDWIWTHNDNTDTNLYALDTANGNSLQTYPLSGIVNNDWEEISQDTAYIYLGDFGNNTNGNRTNLKIYRIEKNSLLSNSPLIDTIKFSYSGQTDYTPTGANNTDYDCEAFIVATDSIFLFTKQWLGKQTSVYALPKTPGTYTADYRTTFDVGGLITGATYLAHKRLVVLCGYSNTLQPFAYLLYDFHANNFFSGNKRKISISLPYHQIEGVATHNGLYYYFSNEYFSLINIISTEQKLQLVDFSPYLSTYLNTQTANISHPDNFNNIIIFPNPAKEIISVKRKNDFSEKKYSISDIAGKIIMTGLLVKDSPDINIGKLKRGTYFLKIEDAEVFKWIKE